MDQTATLELTLLGGFQARVNGGALTFPTRHCGFLLSILALEPAHSVSRETLAGRLWSTRAETQAKASLRQTIYHLQKVLSKAGANLMHVDRHRVALECDALGSDVARLEVALEHDPESVPDLYRGELLADCGRTDPAFDEWLREERARQHERVISVLRGLVALQRESGAFALLERIAATLVQLDRYDEGAWRDRMVALAGQRRRTAAIAVYTELQTLLKVELGVEPETATQHLANTLREGSDDTVWPGISHSGRLTPDPTASVPVDSKRIALDDEESCGHGANTIESLEPERTTTRASIAQTGTLAERRTISLFALSIAETPHDPEVFAESINALCLLVQEPIEQAGGRIVGPIGDTLIAIFGTGGVSETHAVDAVRIALQLGELHSALLGGIGVVSGESILHVEGRDVVPDHNALGMLAAEASTLARSAAPQTIHVADSVATRLTGFFELAPPDAGEGHCVVAETGARTRWQAWSERRLSVFTSRSSELVALDAALACATQGRGRVVALVGEAGIGKSRLVHEFLDRLNTQAAAVLTLTATAREAQTPFGPVPALLRDWLGRHGTPSDLEHAIEAEFTAGVIERGYRPALLAAMGLATAAEDWSMFEAGERRRQIAGLVRAIIDAECDAGPIIVIAEDLHWFDSESIALLNDVVDDLSGRKLLLLVTYRPEHECRWLGRSGVELLRLEPLAQAEVRVLLDTLLGADPTLDALKTRVAERTGGIPLFIEETVRALIDDGILNPDIPRKGASVEPGGEPAIPASVRDVLAARIAALEPTQRQLLQCAAVIGVNVPRELLHEVIEWDYDTLDTALGSLRAAEMLYRRRRIPDEINAFRHALIHDVAYDSVLLGERRRLHRRVFDALERRRDGAASERAAALAFHAIKAQDWPAAVQWQREAGDQFAEFSAYRQACDAYLRALDAESRREPSASGVRREIELRLRLRPVLVPLGDFDAALEHLDAAEASVQAIDDRALAAAVHLSRSYLFSTHGRLDSALVAARRAADEALESSQLAKEAALALGQALSLLGDWQQTMAVLEPTLPYWEANRLERFGHTGTRAVWCHGHLAHAHTLRGALSDAMRHAERAAQIAAETERPLDAIFADHRRGEVLFAAGQLAEAVAVLEPAMARAREVEAPIFECWFACHLAPAYQAQGLTDAAALLLTQQQGRAQRLQLRQFEACINRQLGELALNGGDAAKALDLGNSALEVARDIGDLELEPAALRLCALARHALGIGSGDAERALALAEQRGLVIEASRCRESIDAILADS